MQVVTWNVNSVRARLPRILPWLAELRPEVVCLQETKCLDEAFPVEEFEELGYECALHGQKTYNGVAILSRVGVEDVVCGVPGEGDDAQARVIAGTVGDLRLLNLYVVNGKSVGDSKYDFKLEWMQRVADYVAADFPMDQKIVVVGDFNVTFDDRDVHDPDAWRGKILCSQPERDALAAIMEPGLTDAFREFESEGGHYTWWDFRTRGFQRGLGLRIDHVLLSPPAMEACTGVRVDLEERAREKPSDHAPVIASFG